MNSPRKIKLLPLFVAVSLWGLGLTTLVPRGLAQSATPTPTPADQTIGGNVTIGGNLTVAGGTVKGNSGGVTIDPGAGNPIVVGNANNNSFIDLGTPTDNFSIYPLKFGSGNRYGLFSNRAIFNGVPDNASRWVYNDSLVPGDVNLQLQMESAYQNGSERDSEFHYRWSGPDGSPYRSVFQFNTSWGPSYNSSLPLGYTIGTFYTEDFRVSSVASFGKDFRITSPARGQPEVSVESQVNPGDARLRLNRVGSSQTEFLQIVADGAGAYSGGANNAFEIDSVSPDAAHLRPLNVRSSGNGGASFSTLATFDFVNQQLGIGGAVTASGGIATFGGFINDRSNGPSANLVIGGTGSSNTDAALTLFRNGGRDTEYLRVGAAAGQTLFGGLNNTFPIDFVVPTPANIRSLAFRSSVNGGASFNNLLTLDQAGNGTLTGNLIVGGTISSNRSLTVASVNSGGGGSFGGTISAGGLSAPTVLANQVSSGPVISSGAWAGYTLQDRTTGNQWLLSSSGNALGFSTSGGIGMTLDSNGNAGLGANIFPTANAAGSLGTQTNRWKQLFIDQTLTPPGASGAVTINTAAGSVRIPPAGISVTVTDALCTTNSLVFAVVRTADATAFVKNVVPSAGSFTINLGAAATAETEIAFHVVNQ